MAANKHEPHVERPLPHHEQSDINAWAVGKFAIALVFICILSMALLLGLFKYFMNRQEAENPSAPTGIVRVPPQPRLEETPILDLKQMRDAEDKILTGYGWVDRQNGVVHIPISQAIDLLAQRGLPARSQSEVQTASDASVPTESGLGPKVQQEGGPLAGGRK